MFRLLQRLSGDAANPCGWRRLTVGEELEPEAGGEPVKDESVPAPEPEPTQDEGTPSDTVTPDQDWKKHWGELKTHHDTEMSTTRRQLAQLTAELEAMRQPDAGVVDELDEHASRLTDELAKIPNDDPGRIKKVYRNLIGVQDELARRRAYQVVQQAETAERRHTTAELETVQALKTAGLDTTYLQDAYKELYYLDHQQPGWDRGLPQEQAISQIVDRVKTSIERVRGRVQEVADANTQHKKPAAGVMGEGARVPRASREAAEDEGGDSLLDDLKRLRRDTLSEGQKRWSQLIARPAK